MNTKRPIVVGIKRALLIASLSFSFTFTSMLTITRASDDTLLIHNDGPANIDAYFDEDGDSRDEYHPNLDKIVTINSKDPCFGYHEVIQSTPEIIEIKGPVYIEDDVATPFSIKSDINALSLVYGCFYKEMKRSGLSWSRVDTRIYQSNKVPVKHYEGQRYIESILCYRFSDNPIILAGQQLLEKYKKFKYQNELKFITSAEQVQVIKMYLDNNYDLSSYRISSIPNYINSISPNQIRLDAIKELTTVKKEFTVKDIAAINVPEQLQIIKFLLNNKYNIPENFIYETRLYINNTSPNQIRVEAIRKLTNAKKFVRISDMASITLKEQLEVIGIYIDNNYELSKECIANIPLYINSTSPNQKRLAAIRTLTNAKKSFTIDDILNIL
ncbi:MAG: hypothetical protein HQK53_17415 [Oligoflexia bacterium]|nr:hypothetical protein [Oligoflexia bacterium]